MSMTKALALAALLPLGFAAVGDQVVNLKFPVPGRPNSEQAIDHKVYDLNQDKPRRIAWGISGKFAGIDPMVPLSHHKYGIEIKFIFNDGTSQWFEPTRKFTVKNPGWQHFSGVYKPSRAVKQVFFFYRLATPGEAWYDGVTLFEVPDEPARGACRMVDTGEEITLENDFLRCTVLPGKGATVRELVDRRTGVNYAGELDKRRMFMDKLRRGGNCFGRQWKAEVKKNGADEVSVEFSISGVPGFQYLDIARRIVLAWSRGTSEEDRKAYKLYQLT